MLISNSKIKSLSDELFSVKLVWTKVVEKFKATVKETAVKASHVGVELKYMNEQWKAAIDQLQTFMKEKINHQIKFDTHLLEDAEPDARTTDNKWVNQLIAKLSSFYDLMFEQIVTENETLRQLLSIHNTEEHNFTKLQNELADLESESSKKYLLNDENFDNEDVSVKSMIDKAINNTHKRKIKHDLEQENLIETPGTDVYLLPNKEAAHKNMKPKTVYLLGSPDASDEDEEDEEETQDVIKNFKSEYLL
jgi:hypothetical protein